METKPKPSKAFESAIGWCVLMMFGLVLIFLAAMGIIFVVGFARFVLG